MWQPTIATRVGRKGTREQLAIVKALDHFQPYLYGARFTVYIDHVALRWLRRLKNSEGQLARWNEKLNQHFYKVEHRPGRVHHNADALSRRLCTFECRHCSWKELKESCKKTQVLEAVEAQRLREAQRQDPDIGPIVT